MDAEFSVPARRPRSWWPPRNTRFRPHVEHADAFRRVQLVAGQRQHVDFGGLQVDRQLADGLHRVAVEHDAFFMRHLGHFLDRKQRPGFVVGPHDGDDRDAVVEQGLVLVEIDAALLVHRQLVHHVALFFELVAQRQDGRVLDHGGDDAAPFGLRLDGGEDGGGIGFGTAGGEDDFGIVRGAEQGLHLDPGLLQRLAHLCAETVDGRGIAELLGEERQHGFDDRRIAGRRCVVVHVDGFHGGSLA